MNGEEVTSNLQPYQAQHRMHGFSRRHQPPEGPAQPSQPKPPARRADAGVWQSPCESSRRWYGGMRVPEPTKATFENKGVGYGMEDASISLFSRAPFGLAVFQPEGNGCTSVGDVQLLENGLPTVVHSECAYAS